MTAAAPALDHAVEPFVLRNRMAGLAVLDIKTPDIEQLLVQLQQRLQLAPGLFVNAPLALQWEQAPSPATLAQLCDGLRQLQLAPADQP